jgi:hypothetical protein
MHALLFYVLMESRCRKQEKLWTTFTKNFGQCFQLSVLVKTVLKNAVWSSGTKTSFLKKFLLFHNLFSCGFFPFQFCFHSDLFILRLMTLAVTHCVPAISNAVMPLWYSGLEFLPTDPEIRVRFSALPDFLRSSESRKGPTQPLEDN